MITFSIKEALRVAWEIFKNKWRKLLPVAVIVSLLPFGQPLIQFVIELFTSENPSGTFLYLNYATIVVFWIASTLAEIGLVKIYLDVVSEKDFRLSDLFKQGGLFFKYLAGNIIYGFLVFSGFILLIVPGVVFAIRLGYWKYNLVERGLGPIDSLKESWRITEGYTLRLLILSLVLALVNVLGFLVLVVGVLVSGVITSLANVYVYKKLTGEWVEETNPLSAPLTTQTEGI